MINLLIDNELSLRKYYINYHSDSVIRLLGNNESIEYSFANDYVKVFFTNKRIIIEEKNDKLEYTFIGRGFLSYILFVVPDVSMSVSEMKISLGLKEGTKLRLVLEGDVDFIGLQMFLMPIFFNN